MRPQRSIKERARRKRSEVIDLDITSLLDILVIVLVFLLKSYDNTGIIFNFAKEISLPKSESHTVSEKGVVIQATEDKVWLDDKLIFDRSQNEKSFDQEGRRLIPLFNELVQKKAMAQRIEKEVKGGKPFSGMANLIVDKEVGYTFLRKLMYTTAEAGYQQYKFVVLGENQ
ncbi:MAG: biopolymer transporter ExbD [Halobacteriovoraceae bacterium]|nr:biopolymer transporter ExbD [Halobacteriovoraceae bacterium]